MRKTYLPLNKAEEYVMNVVEANSDLGYGRMMQMISGLWFDRHGGAAGCVTDTFNGVADKRKRCRKEGHDWGKMGTAYDWCDRCGKSRPKKA